MFLPNKNAAGNAIPWEYLPAGAITPKVGMALVQTGGNLAIAKGTDKPTYISMVEKDAAVEAGTIIPVIRVDADTIYETTNSAAFASVKLGDKVTLHASDGLQVTATTGGAAEVVGFDDAAKDGAGGTVQVRFPAAATTTS
ncbi:MAG: hypothetical protein HDT20_04305 [Oscillibacter sp.]|nr:hypothetical protein [Oscillibacter sp.]